MRILLSALLLVCASPALASGWNVSNTNGQQVATGCSIASGHEFLCIEVGCAGDGKLALHGLMTGEILEGKFRLVVDDTPFSVEGVGYTLGNASSRAPLVGDTPAIVRALKQGSMLVVDYPDLRLKPDFAKVPLRGSTRAIATVETSCVASGGAGASVSGLLRNAAGQVSITDLNDSIDCAFGEGTGTIESVERRGPGGSIDGIWFQDDLHGRS
jgi:hypothetical protein